MRRKESVSSFADIGSAKIAYRVFGRGKIGLVIEGCLGSCGAEWWEIAESLAAGRARESSILVYDRAGSGESSVSSRERSPSNVVAELETLLAALGAEEKIVIVGHSQGGLYAELFMLRNPGRVKGLLLLDPLSFEDRLFRERLTAEEYAKSGVDKSSGYKLGKALTGLGLGFLFKGAIKSSPPFYYRKFTKETEDAIVASSLRRSLYESALEEYRLSHERAELSALEAAEGKLDVPVTLITHSPEKMIEEIERFGGTSRELAEKIDALWQEIMLGTLRLSRRPRHIVAANSSHYIHLTDFELVRSELALLEP